MALGRALVREPAVFLLDEPLSNLDARMRVQMRAELARLHRRLGATMVYVTHDQLEAMTLGDRIVVLNEGAVQQVGTPQEVYARLVHVQIGAEAILVRTTTPDRALPVGARLRPAFRLAGIHGFDIVSGRRLETP